MTITPEPPVVRIAEPAGLLSATPVLLGFHPRESIVVLGLRGERGRVGPVIRVDLPDRSKLDELAEYLADRLVRHADRACVLCYSDRHHARAALRAVTRRLEAAGASVLEAMVVRHDRAEFARDASGRTRRPVPLPLPDDAVAQALNTANTLAGRRVLADRDALQRSVEGPAGPALPAARSAVRLARAGVDRRPEVIGSPTARATVLFGVGPVALASARHEYDEAHRVTTTTAALLAIACTEVTARDAMIGVVVGDATGGWVPVLQSAVTALPDEVVAEICAVLAIAAYRSGDGALAQVSLDRCLRTRPHHTLAHLVLKALDEALPPATLAELADLADQPQPGAPPG